MIVLIRADATLESGTGHVMRCAALGARLSLKGARIHFVCVDLPNGLAEWLRNQGFGLTVLSESSIADWHDDQIATRDVAEHIGSVDLLVVDHYRLDFRWESRMRAYSKRILVIDDIADRNHDCDFLLDQNLHQDMVNRYVSLVPPGIIQFSGPKFALLRTEFDEGGLERVRDGNVKKLLVFFGGTDPGNQTIKVIEALRALGSDAPDTIIVLGPTHPYRDFIHENTANQPEVTILDATDRMAMLIAQADLAIGTCGVTAWERCALGLPCLVVVTAENQREDAKILHHLGAVECLGDADEVRAVDWENALRRTMSDPHRIRTMSLAARDVMVDRQAALAELEKVLVDGMH